MVHIRERREHRVEKLLAGEPSNSQPKISRIKVFGKAKLAALSRWPSSSPFSKLPVHHATIQQTTELPNDIFYPFHAGTHATINQLILALF
ncbi:hypothetical protein QC764_0042390 [Podospora pseudoanserina]|uniref:Uncharacterized protein n=1 Tax=Podospora pseudoanserina TaxID=2609844 RepID=A0ABR0IIF7_9PEZI|nr:hypothetical protein QC764_0042390 [Podospora pseudoanserina]